MHNELRYQSKTHAISEKLSKEKNKNSSSSSFIFFFFLKFIHKKKQRHGYGKGNDIYSQNVRQSQTCTHEERFRNSKIEKQPPDVL
jgi:hypothetical protein